MNSITYKRSSKLIYLKIPIIFFTKNILSIIDTILIVLLLRLLSYMVTDYHHTTLITQNILSCFTESKAKGMLI